MKAVFAGLILSLAAMTASAATQPAPKIECGSAKGVEKASISGGGKWVVMNADQWQFLRGIYVLNPNEPAGLPMGSGAALIQAPGDSSGMVFFLDDDKACSPMAVPSELVDLINRIGNGEIVHVNPGT